MTNEPMQGWKKNLLDRIDLNAEGGAHDPKTGLWGFSFHVRTSKRMMALVRMCAQARGISVGGYMRRAIAKQVALDMKIDPKEVYSLCPAPAAWGRTTTDSRYVEYASGGRGRIKKIRVFPDNGEGFGDW